MIHVRTYQLSVSLCANLHGNLSPLYHSLRNFSPPADQSQPSIWRSIFSSVAIDAKPWIVPSPENLLLYMILVYQLPKLHMHDQLVAWQYVHDQHADMTIRHTCMTNRWQYVHDQQVDMTIPAWSTDWHDDTCMINRLSWRYVHDQHIDMTIRPWSTGWHDYTCMINKKWSTCLFYQVAYTWLC